VNLTTCRFCGMSNYEHNHPAAKSAWVRYGPRHSTHLKCAIEKLGASFFERLPLNRLEHLPFFEIKDLGMEQAFRAELERRGERFAVTPTCGEVVLTGPIRRPTDHSANAQTSTGDQPREERQHKESEKQS
jgi:hypothetical protein